MIKQKEVNRMKWCIRWTHAKAAGSQREFIAILEDKKQADRFIEYLSQNPDTTLIEFKQEVA